jgi:ribosomal protein S6
MTHTNKITEDGKELYEIGLHIVSSLAPEQVQDEFISLKSNLAKHAEVTAEQAPELMQLAYTITKNIDRKNQRFDTAYFGWIKCIATSQAIIDIKEMVDGNTAVLRSIIVKTVENAEEAAIRFAEKEADERAEEGGENQDPDAKSEAKTAKRKSAKPAAPAKEAEVETEKEAEAEESKDSEKSSKEKSDDLDEKIDELIK